MRIALMLSLLVLPVLSGCGSTTQMVPEAAPYAHDAVDRIQGLVPYLTNSGVEVVRLETVDNYSAPAIETVTSLDLGVRGRCVVRTYHTAQGAEQLGGRSANEVRDIRRPIQTNLRRVAPRGRPGAANNPTFLYGRHVAVCSQDASVRRAFKALEVYARDAEGG